MKSLILPALFLSHATAAVVDTNYDNPAASSSFGYDNDTFVTLTGTDSWSSATTVGGWSYVDLQTDSNPNSGWGHASSWFLVELAAPSMFHVTMTGAIPEARPGVTIYTGESLAHDPSARHSYSNNGLEMGSLNGAWDLNSPALGFAGNDENLAGDTLSQSFTLDAGRYTIALGNAADSSDANRPVSVDYDFSFTTSVPEPSTALLASLASLALLRRRR